jgi:nitrate/nitrite transport system substrate-binding protein
MNPTKPVSPVLYIDTRSSGSRTADSLSATSVSFVAIHFTMLFAAWFLAACEPAAGPSGPVAEQASVDATNSAASAPPSATPPSATAPGAGRVLLALEKDELTLGFIKLTDCAAIVIAKEKGFFDDEGLTVRIEAQANWKILLDRVISGELDGAHMLAGQPIGATVGIGTAAWVVTAFSMDLNGNAITVSNEIWKAMQKSDPALDSPTPPHPISAKALRPIALEHKSEGKPLQFAMVFPVSTHNYELRYWLAAAGIHPGFYTPSDTRGVADADVLISVTPPPQMPATLDAGTIQGYCVGEPWNQAAVKMGIGVPVATNYDIWKNNPEKVFGVTNDWAVKNPKTHIAVVKALIRAGKWLDASTENRKEAARILSRKEYVGADEDVIANSMTGHFWFQKTDKREMPDFNVFFRYYATYPYYSDCVWFLTQMRRWGQISEPKPEEWYHAIAKKVYRPEVYLEAAKLLVDEGYLEKAEVPWDTDGYKAPSGDFIDGVVYDGRKPLEYLSKHELGNKDPVTTASASE